MYLNQLLSSLFGLLFAMLRYMADDDFILYLALQYGQLLVTAQIKPPAVSEFGKKADFGCTCPFSMCKEGIRGNCVT